jgi:hypothetical protein
VRAEAIDSVHAACLTYRVTTDNLPCAFRVGFTVISTSCPSAARNSISRPSEEISPAISHQRGDVRLLDAENFTRLCLRKAALLYVNYKELA